MHHPFYGSRQTNAWHHPVRSVKRFDDDRFTLGFPVGSRSRSDTVEVERVHGYRVLVKTPECPHQNRRSSIGLPRWVAKQVIVPPVST